MARSDPTLKCVVKCVLIWWKRNADTIICKIAFLSMAKVFEIYVFYVFNDSFRLLVCVQIVIIIIIVVNFVVVYFNLTFQFRKQTLICIPVVLFTLTVIAKISNPIKSKSKSEKKIMLMPIFNVSFRPFVGHTEQFICNKM